MTPPEDLPVEMIRHDLDNIPQHPLPEGFTLRTYRRGDEAAWVALHQDAEKLLRVTLDTFEDSFGDDRRALTDRCFFLVAPDGRDIGTGTAWYDPAYRGEEYGRVHWICIATGYQGRGLARPLLSAVLRRLARSHQRAYLTTSTARIAAIHLYLRFGFRPVTDSTEQAEAWRRFTQSNARRPR